MPPQTTTTPSVQLADGACLSVRAAPGQPEGVMVGCKGSVSLDARFDAGYFCTVKVGRLEFKGTPSPMWGLAPLIP